MWEFFFSHKILFVSQIANKTFSTQIDVCSSTIFRTVCCNFSILVSFFPLQILILSNLRTLGGTTLAYQILSSLSGTDVVCVQLSADEIITAGVLIVLGYCFAFARHGGCVNREKERFVWEEVRF